MAKKAKVIEVKKTVKKKIESVFNAIELLAKEGLIVKNDIERLKLQAKKTIK